MLALAFALLAAAEGPAPSLAARYLAEADAALDALEYPEALELYTLAIGAGDATPPELLQSHMRAGIAARIAGDDVAARMHFLSALDADPNVELPVRNESLSPKVRTFFDLVKKEVAMTTRAPPSTEEPPAAPAAQPSDGRFLVATLSGAALAVAGVALALTGDQLVSDVARPLDERRAWQTAGVVGLGGAALGLLVTAGGAVLAFVE